MDGRRANELRKVSVKLGMQTHSDGSAYLEQGNTKILATVYGPREARHRSQVLHDRAIINVEFIISSFAMFERKKISKSDKRQLEIACWIKKCFECVIFTANYPKSQIDIYIQVLQADGGLASASINAVSLALVDAGISMKDYVFASSIGIFESSFLLDLSKLEESSQVAELTVASCPTSGKVLLVQSDSKISLTSLDEAMSLSIAGSKQLHKVLDFAVKKHMEKLISCRQ